LGSFGKKVEIVNIVNGVKKLLNSNISLIREICPKDQKEQ